MNYGTREESWDLEGKDAVYTNQVLDYEAGGWNSLASALAHYCRTHMPGPFVQDPEAIRQYFPQACQQEALTVWNVNPESLKTSLPPITLTQEEAAQYLTRMYEEDGYPSTDEANLDLIKNNPLCSLEYEADIITENEDGAMKMKQQTLDALKGYVAMGNYTQEQFDSIADSTATFLPDAIETIVARHSK